MDRRASFVVAAVAALLSTGACQGYNFNPVGHCLIQPGTKRVTLSDISTADVLFVVDDSGSMAQEQTDLGANFSQFLGVLIAANQERAANPPLKPIDFHLAVTSTSVFYNPPTLYGSVCSDACPGAVGSKVCCLKDGSLNLVYPQPPLCQSNSECNTGAGYSCRSAFQGDTLVFDNACASNTSPYPGQPIPCTTVGAACGDLDQHYYYDGTCSPGLGRSSSTLRSVRYPQGDYLANTSRPKVIHFDQGLNWAAGASDAIITALAADFNANVQVGTCGSPQEQGLEASELAVVKALSGAQSVPKCADSWVPGDPGAVADCWPHPKSKLVVVWVTDENDSSSPISAADGVVMTTPDNSSAAETVRMYQVSRFADYLTSLGRPLGVALIVSADTGCQDQSCNPMICTPAGGCGGAPAGTCGGQGIPARYVALADQLRAKGADVVVGSICDAFGGTLGRIGEIVKPPMVLKLPTLPAATDVTILRIANPDGTTRKTCSRPAPPAPATFPGGIAACPGELPGAWTTTNATCYLGTLGAYDWWFVDTSDPVTSLDRLPTTTGQYLYINHATGNCEANPGETYSADYIGQLPQGGCISQQACADALGGQLDDWTCYAGVDGTGACVVGSVATPGTCICGAPAKNGC